MQELNHRNSTGLLVAVVGVAASVFWCGTIDSAAQIISANVDFSYVVRRAEARAREPFIPPDRNVPECLRRDRLNEAQYQQIHFRHERALWAADGLPFRLEFFHPGDVYQDPVHLSEFSAGYVQPIRFVQDFFRYGQLRLPQLPADTGYAGFRILHQLNTPAKWDELGAFLGGTYFRLLGKGQRYGQYARGLALDCGEPDRPEEFPLFTDWWIAKPSPGSSRVHAIALLDSASATGAYEFKIVPGRTTIAEIQATLFVRDAKLVQAAAPGKKPLRTVGLAPLTGMFWFGENSEWLFDDYRPEVHDCDGLLLRQENGEMLWRPLNNSSSMSHQQFPADNLKGFGLIQRDRDFADYEDLSNPYQRVPSVWVQPQGRWGEGDVHLIELSTQSEDSGNVVAFWAPKKNPLPSQPLHIAYTLFWTRDMDKQLSRDRVIATRVGLDSARPELHDFVIDFSGPDLAAFTKDHPPETDVRCTSGATVEQQTFHVPYTKCWRVILKMLPPGGNSAPVDLDCTLRGTNRPVTETWTYRWNPLPIGPHSEVVDSRFSPPVENHNP